MTRFAFIALVLSSLGCATRPLLPGPLDGEGRSMWIAHMISADPKHFAWKYGWIDSRDGIDANEAGYIAALYFESSGIGCGAIVSQVFTRGKWRFDCGIGFGGTRTRPIWVDCKTGAVWQDGGERIENICEMLRPKPNQSLQRNAGIGPAILDSASPPLPALSAEETARPHSPRG